MMGLGTENLIKVDYDKTTLDEVEDIFQHNNVLLIVSTFGTTSHGILENVDKFHSLLRYFIVYYRTNSSWRRHGLKTVPRSDLY